MIAYVIPTRDRHAELAWTLEAISRLGDHAEVGGAQVLVVDNASATPVTVGPSLPSGVEVRVIRSDANIGAAARNLAAGQAHSDVRWLVMLDDDSHPLHAGLLDAIREAPEEIGAIAGEIFLPAPDGATRHESGGLPEVFIGCAAILRRELFVGLGGYDASFDYYAEEYDLSARIILSGKRLAYDRRFAVLHRKVEAGRDMNRILHRLVRNNAWVIQRYAPADQLDWHMEHTLARYRAIAHAERALPGYERGLAELMTTRSRQVRRPLPRAWWDRFTGLHHARAALRSALDAGRIDRARFVAPGKNEWAVRQAAAELGIAEAPPEAKADAQIVATLSPGPIHDALERGAAARPEPARVISPWLAITAPEPAPSAGAPRPR